MIRVGLIGAGGMGRTHFKCYENNPDAEIVAICDVDERKLVGDWSTIGLNVDTSKSDRVNLGNIRTYSDIAACVADAGIDLIDVCLPTLYHAQAAIAALEAGKHVLCEKPMARNDAEAAAMQAAAAKSGKQLVIAHCLRYWPQFVKAQELIAGGKYGRPRYARLHRSGGEPKWSWNDWLRNQEMSGGVPLDMHVHDIDAALWWFGEPDSVSTCGVVHNGLASTVDTNWQYDSGLVVDIHSHWDWNGGPFYHAFQVIMERGTIAHNPLLSPLVMLYQDHQETEFAVDDTSAYQNEIDDVISALTTGRTVTRSTTEAARCAIQFALAELEAIMD